MNVDLSQVFGREKQDTPSLRKLPSSSEIGWVAGFIEGEGSFSRASGTTPCISASQVNIEPLKFLRHLVGGRITKKRRSPNNFKTCFPFYYQWRVSGKRAEIVAALILPLLSKRRKAQLRRSQCA